MSDDPSSAPIEILREIRGESLLGDAVTEEHVQLPTNNNRHRSRRMKLDEALNLGNLVFVTGLLS